MRTVIKILAYLALFPLILSIVSSQVLNIELLKNGNFEQGNVEFDSDYQYYANTFVGNAKYSLNRNPRFVFIKFVHCSDHTSGNGLMMVCDASTLPGKAAWKYTVPVKRNGSYEFSYWASRVDSVDKEGVEIGTNFFVIINSDTLVPTENNWVLEPCDWKEFKFRWTAYDTTNAHIRIFTHTLNGESNDFALDDMSFKPYCNVDATPGEDIGICFDEPVTIGTGKDLGAGELKYEWTPNQYLSDNTIATPTANPPQNIKYYLTITDEYDCENTDSVMVYYSDLEVNNLGGDDAEICLGDSYKIGGTQSGGEGNITINWKPNTNISSTTDLNPTVTPDTSTMYYIDLWDEAGCLAQDSVYIEVLPIFDASISHEEELVLCPCDSVKITCIKADNYLWSTNETTQSIYATEPGDYSVSAYDEGTCIDVATVTVLGFEGSNLVRADSISAKVGDTVDINLFYYSGSLEYDCKLSDFTAKIRINRSVLYPIGEGFDIEIEGNDKILTFHHADKPGNLFRAVVAMGNQERAPIIIDELEWHCTGQKQNLQHGEIYVNDLCQYDTTRLFQDTDEFLVTLPMPHPVSGTAMVGVNLIENAPSEIILMDLLGNKVKTVAKFSGAISTEVPLETSDLAPGTYFFILKTKNRVLSRPIQIVK
jgi:hypothetical protein